MVRICIHLRYGLTKGDGCGGGIYLLIRIKYLVTYDSLRRRDDVGNRERK